MTPLHEADVLFVTDDNQLSMLAQGGLGGGLTAAAVGAEELLDAVEEITARIVFVDAEQAEEGSGFALLREFAALGSPIPVIGMCSADEMLDVLALVRLGVRDVLVKPLRASEVRGTLGRFVGEAV